MIHNKQKILVILQEGIDREKSNLDYMIRNNFLNASRQKGIIIGIELAISWIENNCIIKK